ncbi:probable RNA-dependent RNA polymerase 5, partial [Tanacetum coccineum]
MVIAHVGDGNLHTVILFDLVDDDQRKEAERLNNFMVHVALLMEVVDIALSVHSNARWWYEQKKKQGSKQETTITTHTKAFKAAEKNTHISSLRKKLEDLVSVQDAIDIKSMKTTSMFDFEAKIWAKYGRANCEPSYTAMDSGKTYVYHCYVSIDGTYRFKGPFLNTRRTHLQRELGDDNVLIVAKNDLDSDMPFDQQS